MINNPSEDISYEKPDLPEQSGQAQTQTSNSAKNFITKMAKEETAAALAAGTGHQGVLCWGKSVYCMRLPCSLI